MSKTTTTGAPVLTPAQINDLVVLPLIQQSAAMRVGTVTQISSNSLRIPRLTTDPAAVWCAEGAELNVSDAVLDELSCVPKKLAGLVVITNELAADSSPAALGVVGEGLVRDIARKLDQAFAANVTTNGPAGLLSVATTAADAGDVYQNLDAFEFAKSNAEQHNTVVDSWLCNPSTALKLATLKESTVAGSNRALLAPDPSAPASRVISGIPVVTSPAVGNDIVYGIPRNRVVIALRQGTTVESDRSVFWTSDRTGVKAIIRVSWAFPTRRASPRSRRHHDRADSTGRHGHLHRRRRRAAYRPSRRDGRRTP
jgi:HK97 family phage major capsid protein